MIHGKRIVVVLPAYNAARTLRQTYEELPHEIVDHVILVDDAIQDETLRASVPSRPACHNRMKVSCATSSASPISSSMRRHFSRMTGK